MQGRETSRRTKTFDPHESDRVVSHQGVFYLNGHELVRGDVLLVRVKRGGAHGLGEWATAIVRSVAKDMPQLDVLFGGDAIGGAGTWWARGKLRHNSVVRRPPQIQDELDGWPPLDEEAAAEGVEPDAAAEEQPSLSPWEKFLATPTGRSLRNDERHALQIFVWPDGIEPSISHYWLAYALLTLPRADRVDISKAGSTTNVQHDASTDQAYVDAAE